MTRFPRMLLLAVAAVLVALPTALVEAKSSTKPPKTGSWSGSDSAGHTMTFKVKKKHGKLRIKGGKVNVLLTCTEGSARTTYDFSAPVGKHGKVDYSAGGGGSSGSFDWSLKGALHGKTGTLTYSYESSDMQHSCKTGKAKFSVKHE